MNKLLDGIPSEVVVPVFTLVSAIVQLIIHRADAAKRQAIMFHAAEDMKAIADAEKFPEG